LNFSKKSGLTYKNMRPPSGVYARQTTVQPWMTTPKVSRPTPVVHPIFDECRKLSTDPMWISVFTNASHSKFPRGFSFRDGAITNKQGSKINRLEITGEPQDVMERCMQFFKDKGGIRSENDEVEAKKKFDKQMSQIMTNFDEWKKIPKRIQATLISIYVQDQVNLHRFNSQNRILLLSIINLGFTLGYLDADDIIMKNNRIEFIKGIIVSPPSFEPGRKPHMRKRVASSSSYNEEDPKEDIKIDFWREWEKYLDSFTNLDYYSE